MGVTAKNLLAWANSPCLHLFLRKPPTTQVFRRFVEPERGNLNDGPLVSLAIALLISRNAAGVSCVVMVGWGIFPCYKYNGYF